MTSQTAFLYNNVVSRVGRPPRCESAGKNSKLQYTQSVERATRREIGQTPNHHEKDGIGLVSTVRGSSLVLQRQDEDPTIPHLVDGRV